MRKVIYTCITNNYDSLKEPRIITPGWEYICFTNNVELVNSQNGIWKVIYKELSGTKDQRKIKILNHTLEQYDLSIWIDGSIQINCNLDDFIRSYHKAELTILKHPHRICIYQEAEACIKLKKDDRLIINEQVYEYKKKGLPHNVGMVGSGLIIRSKSIKVDMFCNKWWCEVERFSKRDQLSFNYIMFYNPINYYLIPFNILTKDFILNKHNK